MVRKQLLQLTKLRNFLTIDRSNHITLFQTTIGSSTISTNLSHINTIHGTQVGVLTLFFLLVNIIAHIKTRDTQQSTLHSTKLLQVGYHLIHDSSRNGKTITRERTRLRIKHCIDTNQLTMRIYQSTTRVTWIDSSVRLNKTIDATRCSIERTSLSTYNTSCHSRSQTKRVTNGQYPLTQFQFIRVTHFYGGQSLSLNLNQRQVCRLIRTNDTSFKFAVIIEFNCHFIGIFHHVVIRYDITVFSKNHTRTCTLTFRSLNLTLLSTIISATKEIAKEIVKTKWVRILNRLCFAISSYLYIYHRVYSILSSVC